MTIGRDPNLRVDGYALRSVPFYSNVGVGFENGAGNSATGRSTRRAKHELLAGSLEAGMVSVTVRLRDPRGTRVLQIDENQTVEGLKALLKEQTGLKSFRILRGFPPNLLIAAPEERVGNVLESGDLLTIEAAQQQQQDVYSAASGSGSAGSSGFGAYGADRSIHDPACQEASTQAGPSPVRSAVASPHGPLAATAPSFERVVVPDDNSCLFRAVAFVLKQLLGGIELLPEELRELVAQAVAADPWTYNDAVLGKTNEEYQDWIKRPTSWGGAIELGIFANHFGVQIASFDVRTTRMDVFGEAAAYPSRVYLCYDGIHYDPLALRSHPDESTDDLLTVFPSSDGESEALAAELIQTLHASRSYTDTANFLVTCRECGAQLRGEAGALEHARSTGHAGFIEQ